jgi:centriolar protein POC1
MIQYYAAHTGSVNSTDFHSSGNYLISASSDETCKIFDLLEGRGLFTVKAHNGPVNCATFTNDGQYFATAGNDKHIMIWKSNLLTQFNPNDTIAEIEEQINESQQKPQISQTKSTTFTKEPLKSALRQTSSSNQSKPSTSYANTDKKALSNHKINDIITIDDSVDHSISGDSFSISQGIITQLRSLTDSVLVLEERLSVLEDKFESHCSAEVVNLSND